MREEPAEGFYFLGRHGCPSGRVMVSVCSANGSEPVERHEDGAARMGRRDFPGSDGGLRRRGGLRAREEGRGAPPVDCLPPRLDSPLHRPPIRSLASVRHDLDFRFEDPPAFKSPIAMYPPPNTDATFAAASRGSFVARGGLQKMNLFRK